VRTNALARILAATTFSVGVGAFAGLWAAEPTFKIGDPAPVIAPVTWLKGSPVAKYAPGREGLSGFEAKTNAVSDFMTKHGKDMAYTVAMEDPIGKPISETWVTGTGSIGAPTAGIIDQHGKLVWIGYPDVAKGYTFDQALEDTLAGKVDLARSQALQIELSQETEKYWAAQSHKSS
jgi:hypothetical protein